MVGHTLAQRKLPLALMNPLHASLAFLRFHLTHGGAFLLQNYVFSGFLDFIIAATPLRDPFNDPVPDIPVAESGSDLHLSGSSVFRLAIDSSPVASSLLLDISG